MGDYVLGLEKVRDTLETERDQAREAVRRYADHDRACDARENALYACTCGFVEMIERIFPVIRSATGTETTDAE